MHTEPCVFVFLLIVKNRNKTQVEAEMMILWFFNYMKREKRNC